MSGKAYTMKEMKTIVEYLTEHKVYNEIKGRKMWMDFEKSKIIDRTWQSMKETFLKRILPDIHNPYYQLSMMQINSFRQGCDIETNLNNKLEIRTVSEESNTNIEQATNKEHPSTSNGNASGKNSGEETINTKTVSQHRSSAETVILEPCYKSAEDIQKELESENNCIENSDLATQKSIRDFITYSEPLTPMLQEVIDDFATDDGSDTEIKMKIVEDVSAENKSKDDNNQTSEGPFEISSNIEDLCNEEETPDQLEPNSENQHNDNEVAKDNREQINTAGQGTEKDTETSVQEIASTVVPAKDSSNIEFGSGQIDTNNDKNLKEDSNVNNKARNNETNLLQKKSEKINQSEENTTTQNTTDTLIPNNQEALNTQSEIVNEMKDKKNEAKTVDKNNKSSKRKRANSQDAALSKGTMHLFKRSKPVSDTDIGIKQNEKLKVDSKLLQSKVYKSKQKKLKTSDNENKVDCDKERNTSELEKVTETNEEAASVELENITTQVDAATNISSEIENPCLKSVSLYDEQFTSMRYSESSDAGVAEKKQQEVKNNEINKNNSDDIVLLKSHSEPDSGEVDKRKPPAVRSVPTKSEREKVLANMFGFSGGPVSNSRKRRISYRNRSAPRHSRARLSSGSSEWTSESEDEFVPPPRGRKDRHLRRYLKPKSARIFSLEEEGGLFVMYGKKIYPVVKDGKIVKNYVTYAPERESGGDDESYWKLKYMEEKKRTAKLTKLLNESEDAEQVMSERVAPVVNLAKQNSPKIPDVSKAQTETKPESSVPPENVPNKPAQEIQKEPAIPTEPVVQNKTVKIKITKQNEEVELEGHWSQIHPVLDHVVQIFHKEAEPKRESKSSAPSEKTKISLSGLSTPIIPYVDDEVHEKVRKLETQIFEEIESRDKHVERSTSPQSVSTESANVTKRGKPKRKVSSPRAPTTQDADKNGLPGGSKKRDERNVEKSPPADVENGMTDTVPRRITRTSMIALRESTDTNESKGKYTRTRKTKESNAKEIVNEDANVRYKFPSPPPATKKTTRSSNKTLKGQKPKNRYFKKPVEIVSTRDNLILNTIESSQGYQDSDVSPPKVLRKRRIRKNLSLLSNKVRPLSRQNIHRRSQLKYYEMSDQSSNSCPDFGLISKTLRKQGSSSNSDIYRSESLQLLMPKTTGVKANSKVYDAFSQELDRMINNAALKNLEVPIIDKDLLTVENISNGNNSSNVSLPPSPILSIVENLSLEKNLLNAFNDDVIPDVHQFEECNNNDVITEDVTMLLMGKDGDDKVARSFNANQLYTENSSNAIVTDSFLNKLCTVNLNQENATVSDSLHQKIRNLLLESAKKLQPQDVLKDGGCEMDVECEAKELNNRKKLNKRCSTPLKRRDNKKLKRKKPGMETFVEEEHTASCSQSARRSCPPLTSNQLDIEHFSSGDGDTVKKARISRGRKKRDNIIKVKILRPKAKSCSKEFTTELPGNNRDTKSVQGDSGINDTESITLNQELDKSIELIHNHSETCLRADECIDNSVEYVDSNKSIISLSTESEISTGRKSQSVYCSSGNGSANISHTFFETSPATTKNSGSHGTPLHKEYNDSLITEDLSEPDQEQSSKPSKWYLLSEDEVTNMNFPQNLDYRSDLSQLFPLSCAVPNLSTITETSKENRPSDADGNTRNDLLSQSLFDTNF